MHKKTERKSDKYPIELPSRNNGFEHSPIVDVVESEIYPYKVNSRAHRSMYGENCGNITEVVAAELDNDRY
ncbi:MAG: hypothetical protein UH080_05380 [Ruminococcus sp.]|nr:hypothetical protein [Ruminococcus sp.]